MTEIARRYDDATSASSNASPPRQRGKLVLASKVVEKITSQAASEVAVVGGTSGGILGIGSQADLAVRPKVDIEIAGRTATAAISIGIAYPTPIRQATQRVRQHVTDRVQQLCGVELTRVDINVTALKSTVGPAEEQLS